MLPLLQSGAAIWPTQPQKGRARTARCCRHVHHGIEASAYSHGSEPMFEVPWNDGATRSAPHGTRTPAHKLVIS